MELKIFTVRDSKSSAYFPPFFTLNVDTATRSIKELMYDVNHQFARFSHDFSLYELGIYDDQTGALDCHEPVHVFNFVDLLVAEENSDA